MHVSRNNYSYKEALIAELQDQPAEGSLLEDQALSELANRVANMALNTSGEEILSRNVKEKKVCFSHASGVWRVRALSHERVISASYDGTAKVWFPESVQRPCVLSTPNSKKTAHKECLSTAELSDGTIVTGTANGKMCFWDGTTYASRGCVEELKTTANGFYSMTVLEGGVLATGACQKPKDAPGEWYHDVKLWDVNDLTNTKEKRPIANLKGHKGGISALVTLQDRHCASSSADRTIKLWDAEKGAQVCELLGHKDYIYSLANCGENLLVSGSRDKTVRLWDTRSQKQCGDLKMPKSLEAHESTVHDVAVYGETGILTASRDAYVKLWDRRVPIHMVKVLDTQDAFAYSVAAVHEGLIVAGTAAETEKGKKRGNVRMWELNNDGV